MSGPPAPRRRARELGIAIGFAEPGATNTIVDVPGVRVGHATVWRDDADPPNGRGVARTGVTAIVPHGLRDVLRSPLPAAVSVLNGAGELTGAIELREWGRLETPIVLTSTMQVGRAYDGVVEAMCDADPSCGVDRVVIPVVGECDDSWLNDARRVQISTHDVQAAIVAASAGDPAPALGAVGAGTGMITCGYKSGVGSASRRVSDGRHHVGVLVLSNWGARRRLVVDGVPVGRSLAAGAAAPPAGSTVPAGSCIVVVATDVAFGSRSLERLASRAGLGLARCGSIAHHESGEIFCAFSTEPVPDPSTAADADLLDECFAAVVESVEEAVLDALFVADAVTGRAGHHAPGLPVDAVIDLVRAAGR